MPAAIRMQRELGRARRNYRSSSRGASRSLVSGARCTPQLGASSVHRGSSLESTCTDRFIASVQVPTNACNAFNSDCYSGGREFLPRNGSAAASAPPELSSFYRLRYATLFPSNSHSFYIVYLAIGIRLIILLRKDPSLPLLEGKYANSEKAGTFGEGLIVERQLVARLVNPSFHTATR